MKYVVVVGGTMSGIGKGTLLSSIGVVLRSRNISCTAVKIDPYLNQDAGTMSPDEHGEVYVLEDGGEADLDLGNYERFLNLRLTRDHSITSGKVYRSVFDKERRGAYLGKTVQVVPHVVDEIIDWVENVSTKHVDILNWKDPEICLLEIGGTVGDIESEVYIETLRQLRLRVGPENICVCHLSYIPIVGHSQEQKSKPTQHSVKAMLERGLQPDMIFCRCKNQLTKETREKIALFTQVKAKNVISVHNTTDLYNVPLILNEQNVAESILEHLKFTPKSSDPMPFHYTLDHWKRYCRNPENDVVTIGIVGKYTVSSDSYLSILNALKHSTLESNLRLEIRWIDYTLLSDYGSETFVNNFKGVDGVLVPGGFGTRGFDGKRLATRYCRKNKIPLLGICLALQLAIVDIAMEFEPNACHGEETNAPEEHQVIIAMPEYIGENNKGGTMRLGSKTTVIKKDTLAHKLYDHSDTIVERHRHRYEVNTKYIERLEQTGVVFSGKDVTGNRMSIAELPDHPFFFCTQFHPEYTSTPIKPSPPFLGFVLAAKDMLKARLDKFSGKLQSGSSYSTV
ncbi:CTP synthase, putative [Theileria equi strain WA]|uniref:CTP synthase n=1 Tax=Theileria equi strain WA TaxID=1537102 RepID=L0B037_THEEQ|nr:CTP synthase, putative [Theileria equi strain WA]AFZ80621.1 CTP synthase, putative [Theileria equi strain WA]|eukprot:XP_004830287.1 CTP synthase, putative [Theileria equi strain WA]